MDWVVGSIPVVDADFLHEVHFPSKSPYYGKCTVSGGCYKGLLDGKCIDELNFQVFGANLYVDVTFFNTFIFRH